MHIIYEKWNEILEHVRKEHELTDLSFKTWLLPLKIFKIEDHVVTREFDSCIIRKSLTGRIKPVLFLSNFWFYYLVIFGDIWYAYCRGDYYACYYV